MSAFEEPVRISSEKMAINSTFGAFTYALSGARITNTDVGRYCSIAHDVVIGSDEHPIDFLSTHPFVYEGKMFMGNPVYAAMKGRETFNKREVRTTIGNDVWVGARSIIRKGVTVGDGAIIGAGAVVTKDVAPYEIVGGIPAKLIKMRFDTDTIARMQKVQWWRYHLDRSILGDRPYSDVAGSLDSIEAAVKSGRLRLLDDVLRDKAWISERAHSRVTPPPKKGAIIFLLDSAYLQPLRVFAYSLRHALAERAEDIVIITDDPKLRDDIFANAFADRIKLLSKEEIDKLRLINSSSVSKAHQNAEIGAYWFMKFYVFSDLGYDYHLFLDADMLCLNDSFRFANLISDADVAVAPTIGPAALGVDPALLKRPLCDDDKKTVVDKVIRIGAHDYAVTRSINSGVLYIGDKAIGNRSVAGLIQLASEQAFQLEQDALRRYLETRVDLKFGSMRVWYNFPELPLRTVGQDLFETHLKSLVSILHFNRKPKPWVKRREGDWLHALWASYEREAMVWVPSARHEKRAVG